MKYYAIVGPKSGYSECEFDTEKEARKYIKKCIKKLSKEVVDDRLNYIFCGEMKKVFGDKL